MNNLIISSLTLFLVFVAFTPGSVNSVRMLIKTMEMEGWVLKSAKISCLAENIGHNVKQIVSIQLSGPGNVAIASLDYNSTVTLDKDLYFSKIEAEGSIQKETWKSHLTIMMTDIVSSQSGMYTCGIHYFNQEGFLRDDITSNVLDAGDELQNTVETQSQVIKDLQRTNETQSQVNEDLQKAVKTQNQVIKDLQRANKTQSHVNEDLQKAFKTQSQVIEDLQRANKTQSQIIKDLQEKGRLQEEDIKNLHKAVEKQNATDKDLQKKDQPFGFSARYDSRDKFGTNGVLRFRHVDINIGDGYNPTTGVFTAHRTGMFAFHLTVATAGKKKYASVHIHANDRIVGRVYAKEYYYWDQSSVSGTVMLLEGQTVRPVNDYGYNVLDSDPYSSVFSCYLVQSM